MRHCHYWTESIVWLRMCKEIQTGISCVNDISQRHKLKTEEKKPDLLVAIRDIMEPHSESESHLRTTLMYTNMAAEAVYDALVEKGWSVESLPSVRTISNILIRHNYRLRTVVKTKVQNQVNDFDKGSMRAVQPFQKSFLHLSDVYGDIVPQVKFRG